jgi:hypothetical protein
MPIAFAPNGTMYVGDGAKLRAITGGNVSTLVTLGVSGTIEGECACFVVASTAACGRA